MGDAGLDVGVALDALVEEAVAREVVVDADQVGRAGRLEEGVELRLAHPPAHEPRPHRVPAVDAPEEEVERQPAPLVLQLGLVGERRRAVDAPEIVGLHELRRRVHRADRLHRQLHGPALRHERAREHARVLAVRIPHAVQPREAGRGERLVHGRPVLHPRVALGDQCGVPGESAGEVGVDEARVRGAAAVVREPDDGTDAERPEARQLRVRPAPVDLTTGVLAVGRVLLPEHRVAQRADAQAREAFDVARAREVPVALELAEIRVTHPVDRGLQTAPQLERGGSPGAGLHHDHDKRLRRGVGRGGWSACAAPYPQSSEGNPSVRHRTKLLLYNHLPSTMGARAVRGGDTPAVPPSAMSGAISRPSTRSVSGTPAVGYRARAAASPASTSSGVSMMAGVKRSRAASYGVTVARGTLQAAGRVEYRRGRVRVLAARGWRRRRATATGSRAAPSRASSAERPSQQTSRGQRPVDHRGPRIGTLRAARVWAAGGGLRAEGFAPKYDEC